MLPSGWADQGSVTSDGFKNWFSLDTTEVDSVFEGCSIVSYVLCEDAKCMKINPNLTVAWLEETDPAGLDPEEYTVPSDYDRSIESAQETSPQGLPHFNLTLTQEWYGNKRFVVNYKRNFIGTHKFYLGAVTRGYVFKTVEWQVQINCGLEELSLESTDNFTLSFPMKHGAQIFAYQVYESFFENNLNFYCPFVKYELRPHIDLKNPPSSYKSVISTRDSDTY
mmetsp:Transcript_36446/g.55943  ORF Transcript_36446/g.55943 Transcript_36446/m.55943 type:complete len:223 (+) Transcript_36446:2816-3484(+)